jgi:EpsI family protein
MSYKRVIIASLMMVFSTICIKYVSYSVDIKLNKPFSTFPKKIGMWVGNEDHFDKAVYDMLGVDDSFLANYYNRDGRNVQLYIGYYKSQKEGQQIHSPKNCMPGGGWNIIESSVEDIRLDGEASKSISAVKLIIEKEGQRQVVLYWYQSNGRYISSEYAQRFYMVIDSITNHRTDASFVRLITPVIDNDGAIAIKQLKAFASQVIPILREYIPS